MSKPSIQEEQEAYLQSVVRPAFERLMETGDNEAMDYFLDHLENEEHYPFEAQALRKQWEDYKWHNQ